MLFIDNFIISSYSLCNSVLSVILLKLNKKAQLMLAYPRDAKRRKEFLHFEVITSSSQVGNPA